MITGEWPSVAYLAQRETLCSIVLLYSQLKRWGSTRELCWDKRNWSLCRPVNYKGHGLQWLVSAFWQKPPRCGLCPSQLENVLPPPLSSGKHSCTPPSASVPILHWSLSPHLWLTCHPTASPRQGDMTMTMEKKTSIIT